VAELAAAVDQQRRLQVARESHAVRRLAHRDDRQRDQRLPLEAELVAGLPQILPRDRTVDEVERQHHERELRLVGRLQQLDGDRAPRQVGERVAAAVGKAQQAVGKGDQPVAVEPDLAEAGGERGGRLRRRLMRQAGGELCHRTLLARGSGTGALSAGSPRGSAG
jgi:hypothetical protein